MGFKESPMLPDFPIKKVELIFKCKWIKSGRTDNFLNWSSYPSCVPEHWILPQSIVPLKISVRIRGPGVIPAHQGSHACQSVLWAVSKNVTVSPNNTVYFAEAWAAARLTPLNEAVCCQARWTRSCHISLTFATGLLLLLLSASDGAQFHSNLSLFHSRWNSRFVF